MGNKLVIHAKINEKDSLIIKHAQCLGVHAYTGAKRKRESPTASNVQCITRILHGKTQRLYNLYDMIYHLRCECMGEYDRQFAKTGAKEGRNAARRCTVTFQLRPHGEFQVSLL